MSEADRSLGLEVARDIYTRIVADVLITRRRWDAEGGESGGLMVSGGELREACAIEEAECEDDSFGDGDFEYYASVALTAGRAFARTAAETNTGTAPRAPAADLERSEVPKVPRPRCQFCNDTGRLTGGEVCDACEPWVPKP